MLMQLLENRFIGVYGIILSILVFHLGIAVPIFSLNISKSANSDQQNSISYNLSEDGSSNGDEIPMGDEDDQKTPAPSAEEEEDEKSKELFEPFKLVNSLAGKPELVEKTHKLPHRPFEVNTPPPEA